MPTTEEERTIFSSDNCSTSTGEPLGERKDRGMANLPCSHRDGSPQQAGSPTALAVAKLQIIHRYCSSTTSTSTSAMFVRSLCYSMEKRGDVT